MASLNVFIDMQKITYIFAVSLLALSAAAYADGAKIVKWVDSSGVTHYGDKLPVQEAGRNNVEMNNQGIVVKKNAVSDKKNNLVDEQKLEQERKEKILLASYTKPEEIDLARDRNLQLDQAALQALTQQKINVNNRSGRNNKTVESFLARQKPIPAYLSDELKLAKTESTQIDKQLAQRKLSMQATRKRYAEEKERFIALKYPDGMPVAAPVTTDSPKVEATPANGGAATAASSVVPKPNVAATPATKTSPAKPSQLN